MRYPLAMFALAHHKVPTLLHTTPSKVRFELGLSFLADHACMYENRPFVMNLQVVNVA